MYIAIIADLVGSRQIQDRRGAQELLKQVLQDINQTYQDQMASDFSLTLGDEFQGVLKSPEKILEILFQIKFRLHPLKIRFGVGFGEISTSIDPAQSIGADGPAYHVARQMISEVKRIQSGKKALNVDIQFGLAGHTTCLDALNAGLCLMHFMESGWTHKQRENIRESLFSDLNQSQLAHKKGLNQSTIHRSLTSAGYNDYERAYREFQLQLNRIWREQV